MATASQPASPARSTTSPPLAGWWIRFGAYAADTAILLPVAASLFLGLWAAGVSPGLAALIAAAATDYGIRGLVYAPLLMRRPGRRNGQTLGKQLADIRVQREDDRRIGYAFAAKREWVVRTLLIQLGGVALTGGLAILLDYIWPLLDERNQALHDRVASTVVLSTEKTRAGHRRAPAYSH
jgi:uncharacterized RDD family membrane protein YckC